MIPREVKIIPNWIDGGEVLPENGEWIEKKNPHNCQTISRFRSSQSSCVKEAICVAKEAFLEWSSKTSIERGAFLKQIVEAMRDYSAELSECVAIETGKPPADAEGEVQGAILQGEFWASEGMRLYGRTLNSSQRGKFSHTVRVPHGVAALIIPANTPIANIAWKVFPALLCGNTAVLKASEDAPETSFLFSKIAHEAELMKGVLNVLQGLGNPTGSALVEDERVSIISFTGSTETGKRIAEVASKRLARVSLELGGKNPLVIHRDADLEGAVYWAIKSAFSNAGQRCAAGSRILVHEDVYDEFKSKFVTAAVNLRLGVSEGSDLGPVINQRQFDYIISSLEKVRAGNVVILCGGERDLAPELRDGLYIKPTIVEVAEPQPDLDAVELFGPVTTLTRFRDLEEAIALANDSKFGLTAAIHTTDLNIATIFTNRVRAGVVNVNLGTFGSEPHMPFGGFGISGNGTREPGVEAVDVYSETKNISVFSKGFD